MKLELKHLAPYLPYGLTVKNESGYNCKISNIIVEYSDLVCINEYGEEDTLHISNIRPILRPLSSMIEKESDELEDIIGCNFYIYASGNGIEIEDIIIDPWGGQSVLRMETLNRIYEWLFAHHFDVFNLIENDLAIEKE